jgi:indole-3-glycerol phosphate synthase
MDILTKIINNRIIQIEQAKKQVPLAQLQGVIKARTNSPAIQSFYNALNCKGFSIIAEIKKASPSKGIICDDFDFLKIAADYNSGGANAISVLTEETFFQGHCDYLEQISNQIALPTLRKDFIIDEYQIYEAAALGAKAYLLIAAALTDQQLKYLFAIGHNLKLDALVEIHNENELERVLRTDAQIIGINNRNLKTFNVTLETSLNLGSQIPDHIVKVSESGINSRAEILALEQAGFNAALIGETLMRQEDRISCLKLLRGQNVD